MPKPQQYNPSKSLQENIEDSLWGNQYRQNEINNEVADRTNADTANRTELEIQATDSDIALISAQQTITELDLRLLAIESKEE